MRLLPVKLRGLASRVLPPAQIALNPETPANRASPSEMSATWAYQFGRCVNPMANAVVKTSSMPVHFASGGGQDLQKRRCGARHTLHGTTPSALRVPGSQT